MQQLNEQNRVLFEKITKPCQSTAKQPMKMLGQSTNNQKSKPTDCSAYQRLMAFNKEYSNECNMVYRAMQQWHIEHKPKDGVFFPSTFLINTSPILMFGMSMGLIDQKLPMLDSADADTEAYRNISHYYWSLHVFGSWRNTLSIYRFDESLFNEATKAIIPDDTPSNIYARLPEWCVYVELPTDALTVTNAIDGTQKCDGFWATFDKQYIDGKVSTVLNMTLNLPYLDANRATMQPVQMIIDENLTIKQSLLKTHSETSRVTGDILATARFASSDMELAKFILTLLLWLCAEEPDISNIVGEPVSKEHLKKPRYQINKKTGAFVTPSQPTVFNIGKRLGGELRTFNDRLEQAENDPHYRRTRKRPHIRRGHWHGKWIGTGQNKQFELYWQSAIFVNAD